jgi:hypothetical protein
MFTSIFGMMDVFKQMSAKGRLEIKKYMGVWKWESELMARIMKKFPTMVTKNMDRKNLKTMDCRARNLTVPVKRTVKHLFGL